MSTRKPAKLVKMAQGLYSAPSGAVQVSRSLTRKGMWEVRVRGFVGTSTYFYNTLAEVRTDLAAGLI